jgi:hypothetical protein
VCRASKSHLHHGSHPISVPYALTILLLMLALVLAIQHLAH